MLDADSVIEPGFFDACERAHGLRRARRSRRAARAAAAARWRTEASLAAFTLQGITIPRGRDRLGLSVRLRGTGMAIRREIALAHRFRAPASEDLFFTLDLLLDGVRCRHVDDARLRSAGREHVGRVRRAEGALRGRADGRRAHVRPAPAAPGAPRIATPRASRRRGSWPSPPFALGALSLLLGARPGRGRRRWTRRRGLRRRRSPTLALALVTGLIQARAGLRTWLALGTAPWYLAWKAVVQVRALASVLRRDDYYGPTARI